MPEHTCSKEDIIDAMADSIGRVEKAVCIGNGQESLMVRQARTEEQQKAQRSEMAAIAKCITKLSEHSHPAVASKRRVVQIGGGSLAAVLLAILVRVLGPAAGASPEQIEALRRDLLAIAGYKGVAITNAAGMARPIGGGQ